MLYCQSFIPIFSLYFDLGLFLLKERKQCFTDTNIATSVLAENTANGWKTQRVTSQSERSNSNGFSQSKVLSVGTCNGVL